MPAADDLRALVRALGGTRITAEHTEPASDGIRADWPDWADPGIVAGYQAAGVTRPWRHQVEAANTAWAGRDTAIVTGTGSGKSLAMWLPALSAIRAGRSDTLQASATVLYLCPTKALAADQATALTRITRETRDVVVTTCDGDTPTDVRGLIQSRADAVLTNPDFLHFSLLPGHERWRRLLRGLRFVIVDESHYYRGMFGAHVANVLRRLRRLARFYGADPTFICASATTADPATSIGRLIGSPTVAVVDADTSPHGERHFILWEPPILQVPEADWGDGWTSDGADDDPWASDPWATPGTSDPAAGQPPPAPWDSREPEKPIAPIGVQRTSARREATNLFATLTAAGARTLTFARSRRLVEVIAAGTRSILADGGHADDVVAAYRGGYLPEERRDLEDQLRSGDLAGLATTNALELGMDISGLDAVVLSGWPGTRASFRQQGGRAGRAGADGLVVLVGDDNPLDTYLVHNPDAIFDDDIEQTVFDPTNPWVLAPHLCAAAAETPLTPDDVAAFGATEDLLTQLADAGYLRRRGENWYWVADGRAASLTDLRGTGGKQVQLVEDGTGVLLGTVNAGTADAAVHPGAIYVHQGKTFVVVDLDLDDAVARLTPANVRFTTFSYSSTTVEIRNTDRYQVWGPVRWSLGDVDVTSQVTHFSRMRLPHLEVLDTTPLDMPVRTMPTRAVWWTVPAEELRAAGLSAAVVPGALHAAEHASIGILPLLATCDRWDLGGLSTALHSQTGAATVFVHDAYPGGAGMADRGYAMAREWLTAARDVIATCECLDGCPSCIQSPKCGNGNNPLDKDAALVLLNLILQFASHREPLT